MLFGMNFSSRTTVLIIYGINILFATASIFYTLKDPIKGQIIYIIIFLLVIWFVFHTSIISDKSKNVPKAIKKSLRLDPEKPLIANLIPSRNKTNKENEKEQIQEKEKIQKTPSRVSKKSQIKKHPSKKNTK